MIFYQHYCVCLNVIQCGGLAPTLWPLQFGNEASNHGFLDFQKLFLDLEFDRILAYLDDMMALATIS